ncbi:MAG: thioredoxin [Chloroflexota bacterium]
MLKVTTSAKAQLEQLLQQQRPQPGMAVRVSASPAGDQLQLAWDEEREGDQVVTSDEGENLLLVGPDVAPMVDTMVMDYQESPQGSRFAMMPAAEEAGPTNVVEVTDADFEEQVLRSSLPVEVDFWAPWCAPCRVVSPIYDKLSREYEGRFRFCKVNVDENPQTAMKYQIMSIPTQLFFKDGRVVDSAVGAMPEAQIRSRVEALL